jgi:Flp pilus assembly pilin Flp
MLYQLSYARVAWSVAAPSHPFRGWQSARRDPTMSAADVRQSETFVTGREGRMRKRVLSEQGQTMAEYGVVLSVMTAGIIAALLFFSGEIRNAILRVVGLM